MDNESLHVHVLYESTHDQIPHGCSEIRLLRPLSHPAVQSDVHMTSGLDLPDSAIDVVIIERLWNYSYGQNNQHAILEEIQRRGIPIIFEIDDDLFSVDERVGSRAWPSIGQKMWIRWMIREADGVIVSTENLASRLAEINRNIAVVPNQLDEQLFQESSLLTPHGSDNTRLVCGYMGTYTHMDDLISIIGPLRNLLARHKDKLKLEIVGVAEKELIQQLFPGLPVYVHSVPADAVQYTRFVSWMQKNLNWDFAIAPLVDSKFTQSKSDIKFLDYAVQGIPAIFSDVPAYRETVKHLDTGIIAEPLFTSWSEHLERMVLDSELRSKLARNAHAYVWEERMLATKAQNWVKSIKEIIGKSEDKDKQKSAISYGVFQREMPGQKIILSRNEKVLYGLKAEGLGLEIGPSFSPVTPKREGYHVEILDHADAETLKNKYQGHDVNTENIETVDYVWSGESLDELTGKQNHYDWIIASHVIEHTPDMVSFLQQCESMLKIGGILSLAIPDHRYCFDKFRSISTPGDFVQAYLERRSRHTLGAVWDHHSMIVNKGGSVAWYAGYIGDYDLHHTLDESMQAFEHAQGSDAYVDVHNWRFTPSSFELVLNDIVVLGYCRLSIRSAFPTDGCEFIVQLEKVEHVREKSQSKSERLEIIKRVYEEGLVND